MSPTISDYEWDDKLKIPPTVHVGLKWKDKDGHQCSSHVGERCFQNGKRIATLVESSYVGTSAIGAMHWYASIRVGSADVRDEKEDRVYACGGYGPEKPDAHLEGIRIDAKRKLLKPEKDLNGDRLCKVGEHTHRFNSEKDAKAAAIATFKRKFDPGWVLIPEDMDDNGGKPLAET